MAFGRISSDVFIFYVFRHMILIILYRHALIIIFDLTAVNQDAGGLHRNP